MDSVPSGDELKEKIKKSLLSLGFSACGIARAEPLMHEKKYLLTWIERGLHGTMHWMERNTDVRTNPALLLPEAKSLIIVLLNYYPRRIQGGNDIPVISKYAYGQDYHKVIRKKLKRFVVQLNQWIPGIRTRIFTDSAPVMERMWAVKAGLGWQGKNSLLISRQFGSFVFLGGILSDAELEADPPFTGNPCGTCSRCLDACPTKAIIQPGVIDARRCISYLTIEHKGKIPDEYRPALQNRIFGCDICQDVCPWNKKPIPNSIPDFEPHPRFFDLTRNSFIHLTDEDYREIFSGTPVDRIGLQGLRKNIQAAIQ